MCPLMTATIRGNVRFEAICGQQNRDNGRLWYERNFEGTSGNRLALASMIHFGSKLLLARASKHLAHVAANAGLDETTSSGSLFLVELVIFRPEQHHLALARGIGASFESFAVPRALFPPPCPREVKPLMRSPLCRLRSKSTAGIDITVSVMGVRTFQPNR